MIAAAVVLNRALLLSVFGFSVASAQTPATLEPGTTRIEYSRFWRENTGTLIDAVVSYSVKGTGNAAANIEFRVVDRNGVELMKQTVPDSTRLDAIGQNKAVQLAIPLQFVVAPGEYTLNVKVSLGEQRDSAQARISAFTEAPLMSDLLISSSIRVLKEGDSASVAESRKGSLAIQRQPQVVLDANGAKLWYYVELYGRPSQQDSAALAFSVNAPDGKSVLNLQRKLALGDRGRIDAGNIPLIGIPQGNYRLNVQANAGARSERRQADFSVAQIAAVQTRPTATPSGATTNRQLYERYFAPEVRTDSMIADLVGALRLAPPARTFPAFAEKAEPQVQRDALARYFEALDPEPTTETHELLDEYIKRLEYVNRQFTEREGRRAGYRTPRGRIFLKYGGPDQSQLIPQGRRMVEVWKFSQQRGLKFVFLDETGFGHFTLVMTNDPNEQSIADWENRIGDADVVRAVLAF